MEPPVGSRVLEPITATSGFHPHHPHHCHHLCYCSSVLCTKHAISTRMDVAPWCYKWDGYGLWMGLDGYLRAGVGIEHLTVLKSHIIT